MRKKYVYNEDLSRDQKSSSLIADVYDLTSSEFGDDGWLYTNGWPVLKLEKIIEKIRTITPYDVSDNPKFFDLSIYGYSLFNHAFHEHVQRSCIDD